MNGALVKKTSSRKRPIKKFYLFLFKNVLIASDRFSVLHPVQVLVYQDMATYIRGLDLVHGVLRNIMLTNISRSEITLTLLIVSPDDIVKLNLSRTATSGTEQSGDCREVAVVDKQEADLATAREHHWTTAKRAKRIHLAFRYPVCRSAIGQASCLFSARRRLLTFPFCC